MVIDLDHLAGEMDAIEERGVKVGSENLKLSDKATISMPWHKVQDGLGRRPPCPERAPPFGSTRRGIAYAYSDKYRKKTLRLGDLLHLDEKRVQDRLHMILESKNLELGRLLSSGTHELRRPAGMVPDAGRTVLHRISVMRAHSCSRPTTAASASCWKPSWVPCGISIMVSSPSLPAPTRWPPMRRWAQASRIASLDHVVGVLKAYSTCVGAGPFAAENAMSEGLE